MPMHVRMASVCLKTTSGWRCLRIGGRVPATARPKQSSYQQVQKQHSKYDDKPTEHVSEAGPHRRESKPDDQAKQCVHL